MRVLAIGDVHGCLRSLITLLAAVEPRADDRIIMLGDYVDRGPDSRGVLDCVIGLHETGRLVPLRGNHEVMMLEARRVGDLMWLACGGRQTLHSYGVADQRINELLDRHGWLADPAELLAGVPARHWKFLEEECVPFHETPTHFFVHANAHPDVPLDEQPDYMLYWEKLTAACAHCSSKVMVCGHTRQKDGMPLDLGTTVCIDTGAHDDGWLTCLDVHTGRLWQANELGKARTGWLDDCR
jgi:serine/threonine protein phosphatase 1